MPRNLIAPVGAAALLLLIAAGSLVLSTSAGRGLAAEDPAAPRLDRTNRWSAYQVIGLNPIGVVSPRNNVGLQVVGPGPGENNVLDAFSYNGTSQYVAERYNWSDHRFLPVQKGENIGGYFGAAFDGKGDPVDAGLMFIATETQTPEKNGVDAEIWYTPSGSTALTLGLAVNSGGLGGVTVGGAHRPGTGPPDLGPGTLNAADSIVTMNHFSTSGGHGTVTACGTASFVRGTDQAGAIATRSGATSCTYAFAKAWTAPPVCMVQVVGAPSPTAFVTSEQPASLTVSFSAPFSGVFQYLCMGAS